MDMVRTFVETPGFRKKVAPLVKGAECGLDNGDWVKFILDLPLECAPGEKFVYNSANTHLLSAISQLCK